MGTATASTTLVLIRVACPFESIEYSVRNCAGFDSWAESALLQHQHQLPQKSPGGADAAQPPEEGLAVWPHPQVPALEYLPWSDDCDFPE